MDYAQQQRSPRNHLVGIAVVVIFHILVGWGLVNGMATRIVDATKAIMQTKIIEERKKPRDDTPPPPPPKLVQLPPSFVPPPEVQIHVPVTISPAAPITPTRVAPPPVKKEPIHVGVACPNSQKIRTEIGYPTQARRDGLEGNVLIEFTVSADGSIKDIDIKNSTDRVFNNVSINAVKQFKCNAQGRDVRVTVPFSFKLVD